MDEEIYTNYGNNFNQEKIILTQLNIGRHLRARAQK